MLKRDPQIPRDEHRERRDGDRGKILFGGEKPVREQFSPERRKWYLFRGFCHFLFSCRQYITPCSKKSKPTDLPPGASPVAVTLRRLQEERPTRERK